MYIYIYIHIYKHTVKLVGWYYLFCVCLRIKNHILNSIPIDVKHPNIYVYIYIYTYIYTYNIYICIYVSKLFYLALCKSFKNNIYVEKLTLNKRFIIFTGTMLLTLLYINKNFNKTFTTFVYKNLKNMFFCYKY